MPEIVRSRLHTERVPYECAGVSNILNEPLLGTAPHAVAWLLLEHPGPWPATAPGGLLDAVIADELERRCAEHRVRMVAVRRAAWHGAARPQRCYVASCRPGHTWIERVTLAEPKDLLDLDLEAVARGVAPGAGDRLDGPMFAVCTHGKHDACCAAHGRPVQRALERLAPWRVWESTHVGGHRFAANVVVLPEGLVYGRVDQHNAGALFTAHDDGSIVAGLWRGRSASTQPEQAAEWFARRATGVAAVDGITCTGSEGGPDSWVVRLQAEGRSLEAVVERIATDCPRVTGCAGGVSDPGRWRLHSLT